MNKNQTLQQSLSAAIALHNAGKLSDAEALYQKILLSHPTDPDTLSLLGTLNIQGGHYEEAARLLTASLKAKPSQPEMHNNLGHVLHMLKRRDEAIQSFDQAIALKSDYPGAYYNRGVVLLELKRFSDALISFDKALALNPNYLLAHHNRGVALWELKQHEAAIISYNNALVLKPDYAPTYYNRAVVFMGLRRCAEALDDYRQALRLNPDMPYALGDSLLAKMQLADWSDLEAMLADLAKRIETGKPAATPLILSALPLPPELQKTCAELYVRKKCPPAASPLWNGERYAHDKIRIGYFSADFHIDHPMAHLMAGVFEHHDRSKFEVTAFSFGQDTSDPMRQRLEKAFDRFIDVKTESPQAIAAMARQMEIDIAVDLMGFTQDSCAGIFAQRPAPVQVNYLGFPATMGAPYMDYIIADAFVTPPQNYKYYSEKVITMPHCFQANDNKRFLSSQRPSRLACGLPAEGFVFCSFNNTYKITPVFFAIWIRLLQSVPGSVLWLVGKETVQRHLRAEAVAQGVDPSRLIFAKRMAYAEHLARLPAADLFLDSLPFNAGTTASDALWMGLPLITCAGDAFSSRMAGSLLTTLGLPELITFNTQDYEALAHKLATQPKLLSDIREKLSRNRTTSPLFDTARFTKNLENAYVQINEKSQRGLPPCDIHVNG